MKPGDHPEFFRFPAPEGRSRESSIVLDGEGRFWHDGVLVEKASMNRAFAAWIRRHPDDGRFILSNDYDWTYFKVEDVPFFVRTLSLEDDSIRVTLSDGSAESLDLSSLLVGARDALYCLVKRGQFEARFMPGAQTALAPLLATNDEEEILVSLGDKTYPIGKRK